MKEKLDIKILFTRSIYSLCSEHFDFFLDVSIAVRKFKSCDWGTISDEDWELNDSDMASGVNHMLGAYNTCYGKIWIETEDGKYAVVMFPEER